MAKKKIYSQSQIKEIKTLIHSAPKCSQVKSNQRNNKKSKSKQPKSYHHECKQNRRKNTFYDDGCNDGADQESCLCPSKAIHDYHMEESTSVKICYQSFSFPVIHTLDQHPHNYHDITSTLSDKNDFDESPSKSSSDINFYLSFLLNKYNNNTPKPCSIKILDSNTYNILSQFDLKKIKTLNNKFFSVFLNSSDHILGLDTSYVLIPLYLNMHWSLLVVCVFNGKPIHLIHVDTAIKSSHRPSSNAMPESLNWDIIHQYLYLLYKLEKCFNENKKLSTQPIGDFQDFSLPVISCLNPFSTSSSSSPCNHSNCSEQLQLFVKLFLDCNPQIDSNSGPPHNRVLEYYNANKYLYNNLKIDHTTISNAKGESTKDNAHMTNIVRIMELPAHFGVKYKVSNECLGFPSNVLFEMNTQLENNMVYCTYHERNTIVLTNVKGFNFVRDPIYLSDTLYQEPVIILVSISVEDSTISVFSNLSFKLIDDKGIDRNFLGDNTNQFNFGECSIYSITKLVNNFKVAFTKLSLTFAVNRKVDNYVKLANTNSLTKNQIHDISKHISESIVKESQPKQWSFTSMVPSKLFMTKVSTDLVISNQINNPLPTNYSLFEKNGYRFIYYNPNKLTYIQIKTILESLNIKMIQLEETKRKDMEKASQLVNDFTQQEEMKAEEEYKKRKANGGGDDSNLDHISKLVGTVKDLIEIVKVQNSPAKKSKNMLLPSLDLSGEGKGNDEYDMFDDEISEMDVQQQTPTQTIPQSKFQYPTQTTQQPQSQFQYPTQTIQPQSQFQYPTQTTQPQPQSQFQLQSQAAQLTQLQQEQKKLEQQKNEILKEKNDLQYQKKQLQLQLESQKQSHLQQLQDQKTKIENEIKDSYSYTLNDINSRLVEILQLFPNPKNENTDISINAYENIASVKSVLQYYYEGHFSHSIESMEYQNSINQLHTELQAKNSRIDECIEERNSIVKLLENKNNNLAKGAQETFTNIRNEWTQKENEYNMKINEINTKKEQVEGNLQDVVKKNGEYYKEIEVLKMEYISLLDYTRRFNNQILNGDINDIEKGIHPFLSLRNNILFITKSYNENMSKLNSIAMNLQNSNNIMDAEKGQLNEMVKMYQARYDATLNYLNLSVIQSNEAISKLSQADLEIKIAQWDNQKLKNDNAILKQEQFNFGFMLQCAKNIIDQSNSVIKQAQSNFNYLVTGIDSVHLGLQSIVKSVKNDSSFVNSIKDSIEITPQELINKFTSYLAAKNNRIHTLADKCDTIIGGSRVTLNNLNDFNNYCISYGNSLQEFLSIIPSGYNPISFPSHFETLKSIINNNQPLALQWVPQTCLLEYNINVPTDDEINNNNQLQMVLYKPVEMKDIVEIKSPSMPLSFKGRPPTPKTKNK